MDTERARAKVNLYLHVVGRRPDGYHLLDSLAVFADVGDVLSVVPDDDLSLAIEGRFGAGLCGDNLVMRAAEALRGSTTRGARLTLTKELPVASGIGGGSADAAAALRLLDRHWRLGVPRAELAATALALGADVPVCLLGEPARMGGVGDLLGIAPVLPACGLLLVNPGVPVPTASVFSQRDAAFSEPATLPAQWESVADMCRDLSALRNDLEAPAIRLHPVIADVLAWLRALTGCRLARMSGSGATCFAVFDDPAVAREAASTAPQEWWAWGGSLHRPAG